MWRVAILILFIFSSFLFFLTLLPLLVSAIGFTELFYRYPNIFALLSAVATLFFLWRLIQGAKSEESARKKAEEQKEREG